MHTSAATWPLNAFGAHARCVVTSVKRERNEAPLAKHRENIRYELPAGIVRIPLVIDRWFPTALIAVIKFFEFRLHRISSVRGL